MRLTENLGLDDVDEMLHEGVSFKNVSEIAVRFDCQSVNIEQITWEWKRNGELHCTNTFQSNECDQSTIMGREREPGKYLITLFSKGGYVENLQPSHYDLAIYVSGVMVLNGSINISN